MSAPVCLDGRDIRIDLTRPLDLSVEIDFEGGQARHFGAPRASSRPYSVPGFCGSVAGGASCNCDAVTLIPHCNGTHTECAGHLTKEPLHAQRVAPRTLLPALLLSVRPVAAQATPESSDPRPAPEDHLITRAALEAGWPAKLPLAPRALVIRTLPNDVGKRVRDYSGLTPPYLTREAAQGVVERGIEHLVVDVPSLDRAHDEGRLTAHRIFFGLPPGATSLARAERPQCTITELAFVADEVADGPYFLQLQVPALNGDAVPSRPLLFPLLA